MKITFTGKFTEYLLWNLLLTLLSVCTLGLGLIYQAYWNQKYFVDHLKIENNVNVSDN